MTTQLELAYVLRKHNKVDLFDSDLPIQISIPGQITFLNPAEMEAEVPNAIMGIQIQQAPNKQILHFLRRSPAGNLVFPDDAQENFNFKRLKFRILTTANSHGHETNFAICYDINKDNYQVTQGNALPGNNWLALVTLSNGSFNLLHVRDEIGPGSGDPCAELGCANASDWALKIKCILIGCPIP